jgi:hypothetical protein
MFLEEETYSCVSLCPADHYEVKDGTYCKMKSCVNRIKNESKNYICGSVDCYLNGDACQESCNEGDEPNENGICTYVPIPCNQVDVNKEMNPVCSAHNCVYVEGPKCADKCPSFYVVNHQGICEVIQNCDEREKIETEELPCGNGCYLLNELCEVDCDELTTPNENNRCLMIEKVLEITVGGSMNEDYKICGISNQINCRTLNFVFVDITIVFFFFLNLIY